MGRSITSFNLRAGGPQAMLAAAVIALCFCAWCVQLGGVASLQAACPDDLSLGLNDAEPNIAFLLQQQQQRAALSAAQSQLFMLAATITQLPSLPAANQTALVTKSLLALSTFNVALMGQLPHMMESIASLTSRSTSGVFTLTPDQDCATYYRYQWLNTALQLAVLLLAVFSLLTHLLATARVAICCMLTVATVLAIENAHTFFYVRQYAPDLSLLRGKVFFVGCVITAASNLFLLFVLGIHDEASPPQYTPVTAPPHPPHTTHADGSPSAASAPYRTSSEHDKDRATPERDTAHIK